MLTSDGFDLNAYKQINKSSYDVIKPTSLGHVIEDKIYDLNDMQRIIQSQGGGVVTFRTGFGYTPSQLVRISAQPKDKQLLAQYITIEKVNDKEGDNAKPIPKSSLFDRL